MANVPERGASPRSSDQDEEPLLVSIQVVSPHVPNALSFPDLPINTTIRQLQDQIRARLTVAEPETAQLRLIHLGKLLAQPDATLEAALGAETIRAVNRHIIHLAVKGPHGQAATSGTVDTTAPSRNGRHVATQPVRTGYPGSHSPLRQPALGMDTLRDPQSGAARQTEARLAMQRLEQARIDLERRSQRVRQGVQSLQAERDRLQELQQFASPHLTQRRTGSPGQPFGPGPTLHRVTGLEHSPGAPPLGTTRTSIREGMSPDGTQWRVTINETYTARAPATSPNLDVNVTSRPASSISPAAGVAPTLRTRPLPHQHNHNGHLEHPTSSEAAMHTAQGIDNSTRRHGSTVSSSAFFRQQLDLQLGDLQQTLREMATPRPDQLHRSPGGPEVYILNSADGPQAILINNANNNVYASASALRQAGDHNHVVPEILDSLRREGPRLPVAFSRTQAPLPPSGLQQLDGETDVLERWRQDGRRRQEESRRRLAQVQQTLQQHIQPHPQRQGQGGGRAVPRLRPLPNRQNNHGAAALLAWIWPHVWLLIRILLLVWWFTSPDTSWTRWFGVIAGAIAVLVVNTGVLNGLGDNAWQPFRRHLERLLLPVPADADNAPQPQAQPQPPNQDGAADPARPEVPGIDNSNAQPVAAGAAENAAGRPPSAVQQAPLDPREAAARLVARRREANANWLMDQVRRAERAGLLFLASIAPGVAERHIANLEAEARTERMRREAAVAAAEAEAAAAAAAAAEAEAAAEANAETAPMDPEIETPAETGAVGA